MSSLTEDHREVGFGENVVALESQSAVAQSKRGTKWLLLLLHITCVAVGAIGAPLLLRLYFMHGGNSIWLSSWLQSVGFLFLVAPFSFVYFKETTKPAAETVFFMEPKLFIACTAIGLTVGLDNYLYSLGLSYLPVSTSALLLSTQLVFTALFAFFLVKQRFTFYSMNSVVLMTLGAVVLAFHTTSDRPPGVSEGKYLLGFFVSLAAAALLGLVLPLIQLTYSKSKKSVNYMMVMQFQIVISISSTLVCTIGMLISKDFKIIPREAREYGLGKVNYYVILVASAILWQLVALGIMGVVSSSSSLFAGILSGVLLPLTQLSAIIVFHEKFTGEKGMASVLCLWGFISYFIGEHNKIIKNKPNVDDPQDGS